MQIQNLKVDPPTQHLFSANRRIITPEPVTDLAQEPIETCQTLGKVIDSSHVDPRFLSSALTGFVQPTQSLTLFTDLSTPLMEEIKHG